MRAPIGLRIRNYRKTKGLSQAALAKSVAISASYLNLIEANKRNVGGTLLHRIAAELDVSLHDLTGETELHLINELREAFADPLLAAHELGPQNAHEIVAQLPHMAQALHTCYRGYLQASASASAFANRLQSDPLFSQLLHQMLSRITAIRSASEILQDIPDVSFEQRADFYSSIHEESRALSDLARSLIAQFDQDVEQHHSITPLREVNDMIVRRKNHFPELEDAARRLQESMLENAVASEETLGDILLKRFSVRIERDVNMTNAIPGTTEPYIFDAAASTIRFAASTNAATRRFQLARRLGILTQRQLIQDMCATDPHLTSPDARNLAFSALISYFAGALILPYDTFLQAARNSLYDVDFLARHFSASFEQIAHRLVTLRKPGHEGIPFGFLRADPSGYLTKQFPLPGLLMPSAGHACPLWAIYRSLRTPGEVIRQTVSFADGSRYLFIAKTSAKRVATFNDHPVFSAVMLACNLMHADKTVYARGLQLENEKTDTAVGPSCNLCVRDACPHRNAPLAGMSRP